MSKIIRIEIDLDKNKTRTLISEGMPEKQKKEILTYLNKEGKHSLNRVVRKINDIDKKYEEEKKTKERVVKGFKIIKGNKK